MFLDSNTTTSGTTLFSISGDAGNGYLRFFYDAQPYTVLFQGIPSGLQESRSASFQAEPIVKRSEPMLIYQFTEFKEINFSLTFLAQSPQEQFDLFIMANLLRRSVFPTRRGVPMYQKVFLGPWFINYKPNGNALERDEFSEPTDGLTCLIKSYTLTPSENRGNDTDNLSSVGQLPDFGDQWAYKAPVKVDVNLGLYVFLSQVWSAGGGLDSSSMTALTTNLDATSINQPSQGETDSETNSSFGYDSSSSSQLPTPSQNNPTNNQYSAGSTPQNSPNSGADVPTTSTPETDAQANVPSASNPSYPPNSGNSSTPTSTF